VDGSPLIAGQGRRLNLDLWRFYTRETQLLGFVMSRMAVAELNAKVLWPPKTTATSVAVP
jgi:hypothetical protein